ncbi:TonB-dependent receptor [Sunxiuqinia rutila]|uniref:TonB-dependent receptor n=1 Tax=Sunxiuqinia rutila TaxID=1397841 RepID=UPI003D36439E
MKLTAFFLLLGLVQVSAEVHSQNTKLNLEIKNQSLRSVLNVIEQSSNFRFFYSEDALSLDETVNIDVRNKDVNEVLNELFEGKDLAYSFQNNNLIVLKAMNSEQQDERVITGVVTGSDGTPIPGVSIVFEGTTTGVITDLDGKFSLKVPEGASAVVVSYIGMITQTVDLGNQSAFQITMEEDVIGVDEVVVVGYGSQQKKTVTGAVSSVNADELRAVPVANAAARLQGRVSGVTITTDNSPGGDATVRVRGFGSVNNNDPLFIVDGVPTTGGLSQINPNDIESMTVLKDASSSAIYGVRAANGVIIITTKRGKAGEPKISFDARYGVQKAINKMDLMNTQEYGEMLFMEMRNAGLKPGDAGWGTEQYGNGAEPVIPIYAKPVGNTVDENTYSYPNNTIYRASVPGTDWYDEIFDAAPIQEYNFSITGGTNKGSYSVSAGYLNQEGTVVYTGFERYAARMNADVQLKDWLKIGESIGVTYTDRVGFENNREGNPISFTYRMQPIIPVYDIAGNFAGTKAPGTGNGDNPLAMLYRDKDDHNRQMRIIGNTYAQIDIMDGLYVKTLFGVNYESQRLRDRNLKNPEFSEARPTDRLTENFDGGIQWNWSNTLNYTRTVADNHKFDFLAGTEAVNNYWEFFDAGRASYISTDLDYMVLNGGESDQISSGSFDEWATFSYFGRLNYSYQGKYLAEAVMRRDASSRFSEDNRWGTFPAFSLGWRISEEIFMGNSETWLDDLKLRFGWGQNGNDRIGNYNIYSTYRANIDESFYDLKGSGTSTQSGFHKYKLGNPDAVWETTTTTNLGLDATLLGNRLEVNLDWYTRNTSDMLYGQQLPNTWGELQLPDVNVGEMKNTGWDLMLTYHGEVGNDLTFDVRGNISHYKNEVVKLNDNANEILYGEQLRQNVYTASTTGQPISSFYGYVVEGYFSPDMFDKVDVLDEAGEVIRQKDQLKPGMHAPYNTENVEDDTYSGPGKFMYRDISGDGKIDGDDRTFIGSPHPDFTYGLNIDVNYKNWDMTMFFQGMQGNDLVNFVNRWTLFTNFQGNRDPRRLYESWTADRYASGAKITMPIALQNDGEMQKNSSFFVEDGSYFRMKDLQIGYTLPKSLSSKLDIDHLRIYLQATNLFTITDYSGLDPELRTGRDDRIFGVDEGAYPTSRMFMVGVNLNL